MKKKVLHVLLVTAILMLPTSFQAQEKIKAEVGADIVSGYIWRGQDLGNVSIQPSVSLGYQGFSLTGWGSVGIDKNDTKEFDLTLGYAIGGFSVSVTDYWFNGGEGYFHYDSQHTAHVFEAQLGYDFGFIAANWYTNFAGNDGTDKKGERAYSSYFSLSAPFRLGGLRWTAEVGATPWTTTFYNNGSTGFQVSTVSLSAEKELVLTDRYSLPLFARVIWNPATEGAYFVFGLSL